MCTLDRLVGSQDASRHQSDACFRGRVRGADGAEDDGRRAAEAAKEGLQVRWLAYQMALWSARSCLTNGVDGTVSLLAGSL